MIRPLDAAVLTSDEWKHFQAIASRFEAACRQGPTDFSSFLPAPGDRLRLPVLVELVKIDFEARWARGDGLYLEDYLSRFPELGAADSVSAELIYEEYRARHRYGDRPSADGYARRFPGRMAAFRQKLIEAPIGQKDPTVGGSVARTHLPGKGLSDEVPAAVTPGPLEGKTVGSGYKLLRLIGTGQFGEVFYAEAPGGHAVAVKRSFRQLDDESSQRDLKALEVLRQLHHIFLLQMHASWIQDGRLHIAMELADDTLTDRFNQCRAAGLPGIPRPELLKFFAEAADALDYLHAQNVVHRDIKPANLLRLNGHAKVADFGLVRLLDADQEQGTLCGTPRYIAPEVWAGRVSLHGDQYSLACTYAEMLLGRPVFKAAEMFVLALHHKEGAPDLDGLPDAEQDVLNRALAKQPEYRYPNCSAFVEALKTANAPPPAPVPVTRLFELEKQPPRPSPFPMVILTVVALAFLITVGWAIFGSTPSPPPPSSGPGPGPVMATLPDFLATIDGSSDELTDLENKRFYRKVKHKFLLPPAEFVVVPSTNADDPRTFYVLATKVSRAQFRAAMKDPKMQEILQRYRAIDKELIPARWEKAWADDGWADDLPATHVSVTEAHCFAEWLAGKYGHLPSARQWDKAGGRAEGAAGPFDPNSPGVIAIGVAKPLPVDRTGAERSLLDCRDMAGNVREFTQSLEVQRDLLVPLKLVPDDERVVLRGHAYTNDAPFDFQKAHSILLYKKTLSDVGFRVAIELPQGKPF